MKLESQVCSLELSKKLKELEVPHKSLWVWEFADGVPSNLNAAAASGSNVYAYSVAELGEMLPTNISLMDWLQIQKGAAGFTVDYGHQEMDGSYCAAKEISSASEADARAAMLIYLLENKLITL